VLLFNLLWVIQLQKCVLQNLHLFIFLSTLHCALLFWIELNVVIIAWVHIFLVSYTYVQYSCPWVFFSWPDCRKILTNCPYTSWNFSTRPELPVSKIRDPNSWLFRPVDNSMLNYVYMLHWCWLLLSVVYLEIFAEIVFWTCIFLNTFYCLQWRCWMMLSLCVHWLTLATSKNMLMIYYVSMIHCSWS